MMVATAKVQAQSRGQRSNCNLTEQPFQTLYPPPAHTPHPPFLPQMYYFYRYNEAPIDSKNRPMAFKQAMQGGVISVAFAPTGKPRKMEDDGSERQLMFSNHSTTQENDGICAESFLYPTQVGVFWGGCASQRLCR